MAHRERGSPNNISQSKAKESADSGQGRLILAALLEDGAWECRSR